MTTLKIVTNNYHSGTSSAILDYDLQNYILVAPDNYQHIFTETDANLLFIGHDFLHYLWDTHEKLDYWKKYTGKLAVWCFEKILSNVPEWRDKSLASLKQVYEFAAIVFSSDESDCRLLSLPWLPQWPSNLFYINSHIQPTKSSICFMGQSGTVGYERRIDLLNKIHNSSVLSTKVNMLSSDRKYSWMEYVALMLSYKYILAPFGNIDAFNTRTYEVLTSGRFLLQQVNDSMRWHVNSIKHFPNVRFFSTIDELEEIVNQLDLIDLQIDDSHKQFNENNIYSRLAIVNYYLAQIGNLPDHRHRTLPRP